MESTKWLGIAEYAKLVKKSRAQIYLDIRLGKIPKSNIRKVKLIRDIKLPVFRLEIRT